MRMSVKNEERGQRLAQFRRAKKLTGLQLAAQLGVSSGGMSNYEKGDAFPSVEKLEMLARLGLNLNWFIVGEGPMLLADLAPAAAAEQGTPEKLAELEARLKALEEKDGKAATARKAKAARINGAHIKA